MARELSPAELESWKALAKGIYQTQQKLLQKRKELQALAQTADQKLRSVHPDASLRGIAFLMLQKRLAEISLAQMEVFPLEAKVLQPVPALKSPLYEARNLELTLINLQFDQLIYGHLADVVEPELAALAADEPAGAVALAGWAEERERTAASAERRDQWGRFLFDFKTFDQALATALADRAAEAPPENNVDYLNRLKTMKIPALSGLAYRVGTALKAISDSEALVKATTAELRNVPLGKAGRPLTDRLKTIFKPH